MFFLSIKKNTLSINLPKLYLGVKQETYHLPVGLGN